MSISNETEERRAWDLYFAAALPLAKAEGIATGSKAANSWPAVIQQAACLADNMLEERRARNPNPDHFQNKF
ncbi:hypothetical protein PS663_00807 [Pseudomonas fluorescens]|jgi:hypothetical protein|nr:hypothetical protein PS663_00807 [Pseudomonas fluorescens]